MPSLPVQGTAEINAWISDGQLKAILDHIFKSHDNKNHRSLSIGNDEHYSISYLIAIKLSERESLTYKQQK